MDLKQLGNNFGVSKILILSTDQTCPISITDVNKFLKASNIIEKTNDNAIQSVDHSILGKRSANKDEVCMNFLQVTGTDKTNSVDNSISPTNKRAKYELQPSTSNFTIDLPFVDVNNIKNEYPESEKQNEMTDNEKLSANDDDDDDDDNLISTENEESRPSLTENSMPSFLFVDVENKSSVKKKKKAKNSTERSRQWREKKKLRNKIETNKLLHAQDSESNPIDVENNKGSNNILNLPVNNSLVLNSINNDSENNRTISLKASSEKPQELNTSIKKQKSSSERCRKWREKQKQLDQENALRSAATSSNEHGEEDEVCITLTDSDNVGHYAYPRYNRFKKAYSEFDSKFLQNPFGYACNVCKRLWFKDELKPPHPCSHEQIKQILTDVDLTDILLCHTCRKALQKGFIPTLSEYNGFKYPEIPANLPPLDTLSERLISPRLPFMQIRRLRHVPKQCEIYEQVINVPVCTNNIISHLPREIDDDFCINVHIKQEKTYKSNYLIEMIDKQAVKAWVEYLVETPLYRQFNITINENFFIKNDAVDRSHLEEVSEEILTEESLIAQQHTLLWSEDKYLQMAGEGQNPIKVLFDEYAEELSFPTIYLGQFRTIRDAARVTPFMLTTSELRRADRRGVTPQHLLYMAMKLLRLRIRDCLTIASQHGNLQLTKRLMESNDYIRKCLDTNLDFLRTIPNSSWYWAERKQDLFAMIQKLGLPSMFLTFSANETGWNNLLCILYRLKNNGADISEEDVASLSFIEKSNLVNQDAVTCAIYFNKLIDILLSILKSRRISPFGDNHVTEYFKRIEFRHEGSPHAHILLWLDHSLEYPLDKNLGNAVILINRLISVSVSEAPDNINLQVHKHSSACYKNNQNSEQTCRFDAPFMPCGATTILKPLPKGNPKFQEYYKRYQDIKTNLETNDYPDFDSFYKKNGITSGEEYFKILRAGIKRPKVFLKRKPSEKWHMPFNPFILSVVKSSMNFQLILDEYSCAEYITSYIIKTDRDISNLQQQILNLMDERPIFDITEITKQMSVNLLNTIEMTSQEAAWFLLREPVSKSSAKIIYIPIKRPTERQKLRRAYKILNERDDDKNNIWKENCFEKYEKRPKDLEDVTFAQFVVKYSAKHNGQYEEIPRRRILRYRNYDVTENLLKFKRAMVTLHIPFRCEQTEIISKRKFVQVYDKNEHLISKRRQEFESDVDLDIIINACDQLSRRNENEDQSLVKSEPNEPPAPSNDDSAIDLNLTPPTINKPSLLVKEKEIVSENVPVQNVEPQTNIKQNKLWIYNVNFNSNNAPLMNANSISTIVSREGNQRGTNVVEITDFLAKRKGLSVHLFSSNFNSQLNGLPDQVSQRVTTMILSEIILQDDQELNIPNFDCIIKFKYSNLNGKTEIQNIDKKLKIVTEHLQVDIRHGNLLSVNTSAVGELCAVECCLDNGQKVIDVAVYIHIGKDISDVIDFIHRSLLAYTPDGSVFLQGNYDKIPIILSGDFNINVSSDESKLLKNFFQEKFKLTIVTNPNKSARNETNIGYIFQRYLDKLQSKTFFNYFSYYKGNNLANSSIVNN